jgi:hypothetical protein
LFTYNFSKNAKTINTDEAAKNFNKHFISITESLIIEKMNAYTAISYVHTHFPKGFPDTNINPVSEEEMISN